MKRINLIFAFLLLSANIFSIAENIVIKSPGYVKDPFRDGHVLFPDSLVYSSDAEEIVIPDVGMFGRLGEYKFPKLKKVTFGNVDYLPGGLLRGMPALEEVVFDGMIGHFDGTFISRCQNLKKIIFKGPISSTGGPGFLYDLPNLESVVFESVVVDLGVEVTESSKCPKLNGITCNGAFLNVYNDSLTHAATIDQLKGNLRLLADMERIARWQSEVLTAKNPDGLRKLSLIHI